MADEMGLGKTVPPYYYCGANDSYNVLPFFGPYSVNHQPLLNGRFRSVLLHVLRHSSEIGPMNLTNGSEKEPSRHLR